MRCFRAAASSTAHSGNRIRPHDTARLRGDQCTFAYAALSDTDVKRCTLRRCDFTESRFDNANLAKTAFEDCADGKFFLILAGIDLSSCLLAGIRGRAALPSCAARSSTVFKQASSHAFWALKSRIRAHATSRDNGQSST
ncbi:MAG: pentapeptide repeat-containing protein [Eggerthellaceae bacterium]